MLPPFFRRFQGFKSRKSFLLLQMLAIVVSQDLETTKNELRQITKRLRYGFRRKTVNLRGFQVF